MSMIAPFMAFLGITLMAVITVSGTFFGESGVVLDARFAAAVRTADLNGTLIDLVSTQWDAWARVNESGGGYHPVWVTYSALSVPDTGQWVVQGTYLDADALLAEAFQPGIVDPGEEFVLRLNVGATAADPGANSITQGLPVGRSMTSWYTWETKPVAPDTVNYGGSLSANAGTFVYGIRGNLHDDFWSYGPGLNRWSDVEDATVSVDSGAALVAATVSGADYIYGFVGDGSTRFLRFSISNNNWLSLSSVPSAVGPGGALAWDGADTIWALKGDKNPQPCELWNYTISTDTWTSISVTPTPVHLGGVIVFQPGALKASTNSRRSHHPRQSMARGTAVT